MRFEKILFLSTAKNRRQIRAKKKKKRFQITTAECTYVGVIIFGGLILIFDLDTL
jgi:hypothetical protein